MAKPLGSGNKVHMALFFCLTFLALVTLAFTFSRADEEPIPEEVATTPEPETKIKENREIPKTLVIADIGSTTKPVEKIAEKKAVVPEVKGSSIQKASTTPEKPKKKIHNRLDASQIASLLSLHNKARDAVGLDGLTWSDELAAGAQVWADTLKDEQCEMRHSDEPYGENIFTLWSNDRSFQSSPKDAVSWWVAEKKYYNYRSNSCARGKVCGHYTQIVWKNTTEVGCALSRCSGKKGDTDLWVCRYDPAGNTKGKKPY